jgi:uncharacterized protein (DUF849 family)
MTQGSEEAQAESDRETVNLNFSTEASVNDPKTIMRLAEIMRERGIRPELEVFDLGMVNFARILIDKGLVEPPFYFNILLGRPIASVQTVRERLGLKR